MEALMPDDRNPISPPAIVKPAHDLVKVTELLKKSEIHRRRSIAETILAGEALIRAKALCPRGSWLPSLASLAISPATAARLMNVTRAFYNGMKRGKLPALQQIIEVAGNPTTAPDTEPAERPIKATDADDAVLALLYCDRCSRTGPTKECKKCLKTRESCRRRANRVRKTGKLLFDWSKKLDKPLGIMIRASDELVRKYESERDSEYHKKAEKLLRSLVEVIDEWKHKVLGSKS